MADTNDYFDVLIVEKSLSMATNCKDKLRKNGISSEICGTGAEALTVLRAGKVLTVILDLELPDMDGLDLIREMNKTTHNVRFIVTTSNGSVNTAVEAMRAGAYDFLIKPFSFERLKPCVENAIETVKLEKGELAEKIESDFGRAHGFIGESEPMLEVYKMINSVANSNAAVFITGGSGTGKEVTAQAIHKASNRRDAPFIALNCASLPEHLIESEIFGHIKGAFTGAHDARAGAASMANGGTLFLDEICEMDISLQAKLLRFLQTGQVKRVGSDWVEDVDVRIICATNRQPILEVAEKRFREDLFYRLDVLSIDLPRLSDRGGDIILLADSFLKQYSAEEDKAFKGISSEVRLAMLEYHWPGNVRELQNMIRKAVVTHDGVELLPHMMSFNRPSNPNVSDNYQLIGLVQDPKNVTPMESMKTTVPIDIIQTMTKIEQHVIESVIAYCEGSVPKASLILDLSPSTIYRKQRSWVNDHDVAGQPISLMG